MREIKDRLQRKALLRAFLAKSMFNGGEVDYLTAFYQNKFYVFHNSDVIKVMGEYFDVENSKTNEKKGGIPEQKVIFRYNEKTVGELEMRNDSPTHYQEVRFNMNIEPFMQLVLSKIPDKKEYNKDVYVYGFANKKFGRWKQSNNNI